MSSFSVGELVVDEAGHRGTVRYVGPVAHAKKKDQVWIGVEWREAGRGKHDGSAVGADGKTVRYFECAPTQGSFAKPALLRKGSAFKEAVVERYEPGHRDESAAGADDSGATGAGADEGGDGPRRAKSGEAVHIQAVGMDKIRGKQKLSLLREASLASSGVAWAGDDGWIAANCGNIRELDLSTNLFESWAEVGRVLEQLPQLEHLNLGNNNLAQGLPVNPLDKLPSSLKHRFAALKVLVLPKTGTSVAKVQRLDVEGVFPSLEELVLGDNGLTSLDPQADIKSTEATNAKGSYAEWAKSQVVEVDRKGFTPESFVKGLRCLVKIDISRNKIASWSEVWRLCRLPNLRHINASDNPIETIFFDAPAGSSAAAAIADEPPAAPATEVSEEEAQRLKSAEEFEKSLADPEAAARLAEEEKHQLQADPGLDIVMSNGTRVPIVERKERAAYTDARRWTGDGKEGGALPFGALESLLLCRTRVADWASVNALQQFASLRELRIQGSPVVSAAASAGAARQTIIARVRGLERLNGSEVSLRERADAEVLYLKKTALAKQAQLDAGTPEALAAFQLEHPRYDELVKQHGCPMEAAKKLAAMQVSSGGSLAANSIPVTIRSFDPRSCTVEPTKKKLPLSMTVKDLKVLCQRLFKVDTDLQVLFYRETSKTFGHPQPLDEDAMPIVDFGVKAGGEIIMEARDPEKDKADQLKRQQQEAAAMKHQEKRAQQEADIKRNEVEQVKSSFAS